MLFSKIFRILESANSGLISTQFSKIEVISTNEIATTTGTNNGVNVEIVSGLKKGDVVAVDYSADMAAQQAGGSEESSPFAPKHPGQKKKEGQK